MKYSPRRSKNSKFKPENKILCYHCQYEWYYNGKKDRISCPRCAGYIYKSRIGLEHMLRPKISEVGTIQKSQYKSELGPEIIESILFNAEYEKPKPSYYVPGFKNMRYHPSYKSS